MSDHIPDAGKMVTDDIVQAALDAYSENEWRTSASTMRAAIAAVAPLIANAERERCAVYHDEAADGERDLASQCGAQNDRRGNELHKYLEQEHILSAAALRALT